VIVIALYPFAVRSEFGCHWTAVMSDADQVTSPLAATTAGIWNMCFPSKAEYIGLKKTFSASGLVHAPAAEPLDEPDDEVEGDVLEEHAATCVPAAPKATLIPTAARSLYERMIDLPRKLMVDLIPNSRPVEQPRRGTSWPRPETYGSGYLQ